VPALAASSARYHPMHGRLISLICAAAILGFTLYTLPYDRELNHLGPDTIEYLEYSDLMLSHRLWSRVPIGDLPKGSVVRGPGFPALLSLGRLIVPDDLRAALISVHATLGFMAGMFVCIVFRRYLPAWASALITAMLFLHLRPWFNGICTEWAMFTLALTFLGGALSFFETPSPRRLAIWLAVATVMPWVRPNFTLALIVPLFAIIAVAGINRRAHVKALVVGLSPLLLLILVNYARFAVVTLTPYGGRNLFIAANMSGAASVDSKDTPALSRFIELVTARKHHYSPTELALTEGDPGFERLLVRYLEDFARVENIANELGLDHIQLNQYTATYAMRGIRHHFSNYLALQLRWYTWLAKKSLLFIPALLVVGSWLRRHRDRPLACAFLSIFSLHIIQMASVIVTQPPLERYLITTHYAILYATPLVAWRYYSTAIAHNSKSA
jgi:hypothetical protein